MVESTESTAGSEVPREGDKWLSEMHSAEHLPTQPGKNGATDTTAITAPIAVPSLAIAAIAAISSIMVATEEVIWPTGRREDPHFDIGGGSDPR